MSAKSDRAISLKDLLTEKTVNIGITVDSWQEAVSAVGQLLVDAGISSGDYINAMQRTIEELGPYSVIAPGIAMPHARPEDGVLQTGFALITLKDAVDFGSATNGLVDIVLAFGAVDKQSHILALKQIAEVLSSQQILAGIRSAETKEELLAAIHDQPGQQEFHQSKG